MRSKQAPHPAIPGSTTCPRLILSTRKEAQIQLRDREVRASTLSTRDKEVDTRMEEDACREESASKYPVVSDPGVDVAKRKDERREFEEGSEGENVGLTKNRKPVKPGRDSKNWKPYGPDACGAHTT